MNDKLLARLDNLICSNRIWEIDIFYGFEQLAMFAAELEEAEKSGIKKDLAKEREKNVLQILTKESGYFEAFSRRDGATTISPGSFAKIELNGVMRLNDGLSSMGTKSLEKEINIARSNPNVSGLLIEVSSGGGESIAGNHLETVLTAFEKVKPVVAAVHIAGSAAYKAISGATEIVGIGDGSLSGSIGSMFSISRQFIEGYKQIMLDIYSDLSPDKNKSFNELVFNNNSEAIKKELNELAAIFQSKVIANRGAERLGKLSESTLKGGIFLAKEAKKRGLIDQIGSVDLAINRLINHVNYKIKK